MSEFKLEDIPAENKDVIVQALLDAIESKVKFIFSQVSTPTGITIEAGIWEAIIERATTALAAQKTIDFLLARPDDDSRKPFDPEGDCPW